jgi:hypothetical protein
MMSREVLALVQYGLEPKSGDLYGLFYVKVKYSLTDRSCAACVETYNAIAARKF